MIKNSNNELKPLISIIIPVYNVENYLGRCVRSILTQTYSKLEILLIDDGSIDACPQICDEFEKIDKRVIVIHKKNGGLSSARNAGLSIAKGEFISFIDSDDYVAENYIMSLYNAIVKNNADMSLCSFSYTDENGTVIEEEDKFQPILTEVINGKQAILKLQEPKGYYYTVAWNKLYKRVLLDDVKFPEGKIHEDEFVSHLIFAKCHRIACIENKLYYYVQRSNSIMRGSKLYKLRYFDRIEALIQRAEFCYDIDFTQGASFYYVAINEQIKKMHKNKDNDSKMSYNGVAKPTKEFKGVVVLWIIAYTIQRKFSRV